jgi:transposase InsO family protein
VAFNMRRTTIAQITASMSRKANRHDNAPMESFFHTLKTERVHHRRCGLTGRADGVTLGAP